METGNIEQAFFFISTASFTVTYSLMSNKHLPSACSKKPFSSSDIRAAEVLTWICPCISCELLHRPHRTQTSKHVCWGRIRMFDLGDVTKKMYLYHIYIYVYV